MSGGEALYLVFVVVTAAVFSLALAWVSRQCSKGQVLLPPETHNH
jgi:hypothetical protein